jgi:hypothetical protein
MRVLNVTSFLEFPPYPWHPPAALGQLHLPLAPPDGQAEWCHLFNYRGFPSHAALGLERERVILASCHHDVWVAHCTQCGRLFVGIDWEVNDWSGTWGGDEYWIFYVPVTWQELGPSRRRSGPGRRWGTRAPATRWSPSGRRGTWWTRGGIWCAIRRGTSTGGTGPRLYSCSVRGNPPWTRAGTLAAPTLAKKRSQRLVRDRHDITCFGCVLGVSP